MKIDKLNEYLHKKVKIKLFDGDVVQGFLKKSDDISIKVILKTGYYTLVDENSEVIACGFKASHVKTLKEI